LAPPKASVVSNPTELPSLETVAPKAKELHMADNKNPHEKQPGEKEPGKYHYNPGNQSGKPAEIFKPSEQGHNVDEQRGSEKGKRKP
jgi:hypothetical protein